MDTEYMEYLIECLKEDLMRLEYFYEETDRKFITEALEKQIPKKPYLDESTERTLFKCSNCKRIRITKWNDSLRSGIETEYCPSCGQKLDWED